MVVNGAEKVTERHNEREGAREEGARERERETTDGSTCVARSERECDAHSPVVAARVLLACLLEVAAVAEVEADEDEAHQQTDPRQANVDANEDGGDARVTGGLVCEGVLEYDVDDVPPDPEYEPDAVDDDEREPAAQRADDAEKRQAHGNEGHDPLEDVEGRQVGVAGEDRGPHHAEEEDDLEHAHDLHDMRRDDDILAWLHLQVAHDDGGGGGGGCGGGGLDDRNGRSGSCYRGGAET